MIPSVKIIKVFAECMHADKDCKTLGQVLGCRRNTFLFAAGIHGNTDQLKQELTDLIEEYTPECRLGTWVYSQDAKMLNEAVKLILDTFPREDIVLMADAEKSVYLIPMVMDEESTTMLRPGTIEYQLSDGPPGNRRHSEDFTDLAEAIKRFNQVSDFGWQRAT